MNKNWEALSQQEDLQAGSGVSPSPRAYTESLQVV